MTRLKFSDVPYYNADQSASALDPDDIFNCYLDETPEGLSIRRRPGLKNFTDLETDLAGQGIFEWEAQGVVVAVSGGEVFTIAEDGAITNITTSTLKATGVVQFSDGSRLNGDPVLYMANGKLAYSDAGANVVHPADGSTPTTADSVVYLNLKFLANVPGTNQFLFTDTDPASGVLEPDYWSSSDNPLTAESRGDDLLGMWAFLEEIYVWGSQGLEIWQDDGYTPFVSIPQATASVGLEAKDSVVIASNTLFALCVIDGTRCVVRISGRTPQVISDAISSVISGYGDVSDAVGQVISVGGVHIYLLQFPTEGKTWAYNLQSGVWVPWGTWNETTGRHGAFIGRHTTFVKAWNKHLIMSSEDGKIYELDRNTFEDGDTLVKSYRRTIWEDHGTGVRKRVKRLRVKIKTGATVTGAAYLRWADDGAEEWSPHVELPLYPEGKRNFIVELTRLGMYTSRRYEITITDDADLCVAWVEEDVEAMRF